jgi:hypothetical protein
VLVVRAFEINGFGNRVNGLKLVERGPEIEAVVDVFETWIKGYPGDIILEKWVTDTLEATRGLILAAPVAKAITCLESTHSNVSDVYLFQWLAVTATIHQIITEDITGLPIHVVGNINILDCNPMSDRRFSHPTNSLYSSLRPTHSSTRPTSYCSPMHL